MLLVDIGNTYAKFKFDNNEIIKIRTSLVTSKEFLFDYFKDNNMKVERASISCVVIGKDKIVEDFISEKYNVKPFVISTSSKSKIEYPILNELGADLLSMMEGASIKSNTFIAISLGTASVITFVKDLKLEGVAIAPGVLTSLNGLINNASLLKNTILNGEYDLLSLTTNECLKSGTYSTFKFMIIGFIKSIKEKYKLENIKTYITGGFAKDISKDIKEDIEIDQDLIFKGMEELYKLNL